jgi:hypothetical protein
MHGLLDAPARLPAPPGRLTSRATTDETIGRWTIAASLTTRRLLGRLVPLVVAGYLLFAHGCHGDEDNELFAFIHQAVTALSTR